MKLTRIILHKALVKVSQLVVADVTLGVIRRLEVQVIFASFVKFRGCHIHANHDLVSVASLADGILQQLKSWERNTELKSKSYKCLMQHTHHGCIILLLLSSFATST